MYMYVETNLERKKCAQNLVRSGVYWTRYLEGSCIGVGAGPADSVLARSLFQRFNKIHYQKNCAHASCMPITVISLQKFFLGPCLVSFGQVSTSRDILNEDSKVTRAKHDFT